MEKTVVSPVLMYLGLASSAEPAAAEGDDAAARIGDREHHAVVEEVARRSAVFGGADETGLDHVADLDVLGAKVLKQRAVAVGGIAQTVALLRVGLQPARLQIALGGFAGAGVQLLLEELAGELDDVVERFALGFARFVFLRPGGKLDAGFGGKPLHGFGEAQAFGLLEPFEGAAARAAAEAVIIAPLVLDLEGGRFFLVEGAEAPEHAALAGELDAPADELDEVGPSQDFFEQPLAVPHQQLPWAGTLAERARAEQVGKSGGSFQVFRRREQVFDGGARLGEIHLAGIALLERGHDLAHVLHRRGAGCGDRSLHRFIASSADICFGMNSRMTTISSRSPCASSGRLPVS